jgi:hypothetical protein
MWSLGKWRTAEAAIWVYDGNSEGCWSDPDHSVWLPRFLRLGFHLTDVSAVQCTGVDAVAECFA